MYQINKSNNSISALREASFSELKYKERQHLQERIASTPNIFDEDMLIIQKEFDWFNETRERLDLLALDTEGNLVIIENKLDDTGRDLVRQSLKYASYCSTLKLSDIISIYQSYLDNDNSCEKAEDKLEKFFDTDDLSTIDINQLQTQRIIMVAWKFPKEVTSTALWLMDYWIKVQCFKTSLFIQEKNHFMTMEQIIPIQDAEEYTISMAEKKQEEVKSQSAKEKRERLCREFWSQLLPVVNSQTSLFSNINPTKDHWISAWSWLPGTPYSFIITDRTNYCAVEIYPWLNGNREENVAIFDKLFAYKHEIEESFWDELFWDRDAGVKWTRIRCTLKWVKYWNKEDRPKMIEFLSNKMAKLHRAIDPIAQKIR